MLEETKEAHKGRDDYTYQYLPLRGLTAETLRKFKIGTAIDRDGRPVSVGFHYPGGGVKTRYLHAKEFSWKGKAEGLFGQEVFPPGSARSITITEGEFDAAAAYQMLGPTSAVVSLRNSGSARKDCSQAFEYLNSFDRIILCLDDDDVGHKAAREVAGLFDFNKVFEVRLGNLKDANGYLEAGRDREFRQAWQTAKKYLPEGVVSSFDDFDQIIDDDADKPYIPYPFDALNTKLKGMREGECVLIKAMEGVGKTEVCRAIEYHGLKLGYKVGVIHLEEGKARTLKGVATYELEVPAHLEEGDVTNDEIKDAIRKVTVDENGETRLHIYGHFGSDDPDVLLDCIRFLFAVCGCRIVVFDHITMAVTGLDSKEQTSVLDYLSTNLAKITHDVGTGTLVFVSHVNDDGLTRGSRNISKVAYDIIHVKRDLMAATEDARNVLYLDVEKARFTGKTGPAGFLKFNPETYKLENFDPNQVPVD